MNITHILLKIQVHNIIQIHNNVNVSCGTHNILWNILHIQTMGGYYA